MNFRGYEYAKNLLAKYLKIKFSSHFADFMALETEKELI